MLYILIKNTLKYSKNIIQAQSLNILVNKSEKKNAKRDKEHWF